MVDNAFGNWLAGFIDGEGCFYIRGVDAAGDHVRLSCRFNLRVRADDRPILDEIRARLGIGEIYMLGARDRTDGYRRAPQAAWTVDRKADCVALVGLIDRYPLRAKKAADYAIWREAVLWHAEEGKRRGQRGPRDWGRLLALRDQLQAVRQYPHAAS